MTEEKKVKRGRGRPPGSKNKSTLAKLKEKKEIKADTIVEQEYGDVVLPDTPADAIDDLLSADDFESSSVEYFKSTSTIPRIGKNYVIKIREPDGRSRILISHLDFNDSFPLSTRRIFTKYGVADGLSCPVVMRLVDVHIDEETEGPIGIYHVISTPTMVRTGVDPRKLAGELTVDDIDEQVEEFTRHKALSYKMQRDMWKKRSETYEEHYRELSEKRMEISEELTATAVEMLVNAMMASKEIFDEIRKKQMPWYQRYQNEILLLIGALFIIFLFASGALKGGVP